MYLFDDPSVKDRYVIGYFVFEQLYLMLYFLLSVYGAYILSGLSLSSAMLIVCALALNPMIPLAAVLPMAACVYIAQRDTFECEKDQQLAPSSFMVIIGDQLKVLYGVGPSGDIELALPLFFLLNALFLSATLLHAAGFAAFSVCLFVISSVFSAYTASQLREANMPKTNRTLQVLTANALRQKLAADPSRLKGVLEGKPVHEGVVKEVFKASLEGGKWLAALGSNCVAG